jgi:pilus assembly protein Flp/PilA
LRNALKGFAMFTRLRDDEAGATAIEYGLIVALIAIAAIIAFQSLGLTLSDVFDTIRTAMGSTL